MLEVDNRRPVRERRTALKLFELIKANGFDGDYSRVTAFIQRWRTAGSAAVVTKAYEPLQSNRARPPVRLERGAHGHRWRLEQDPRRPPQALPQPGLRGAGLSHAKPHPVPPSCPVVP